MRGQLSLSSAALFVAVFSCPALASTTFYRDVLPILQRNCERCHKPGEIGPMPLTTYQEVRPWAAAIRESLKLRKMPPWFANAKFGTFANDARLSEQDIQTIDQWANEGAPPGSKADAPAHLSAPAPFSADLTITAPSPITIPANGILDYQYIVLPLPFRFDRWVHAVEIAPSDRSVVHHAVLYVRDPASKWLREAKPGVPYAPSRTDPQAVRRTRDTKEDILAIYTPGAPASIFPEGMGKKIPAGADLVLQLHYTSKKTPSSDQPEIRLALLPQAPAKRILTLQMGRDDLRIPPGESNYRASVLGSLPGDALLISLFPHMHLRGTAFDFDMVGPNGFVETLLEVKPYNFNWQLNYILKSPRLLRKGTLLRWTGFFDNSSANPSNPDPTAEVVWGEQSWDEMMIGFFDVAVDSSVTKQDFFVR